MPARFQHACTLAIILVGMIACGGKADSATTAGSEVPETKRTVTTKAETPKTEMPKTEMPKTEMVDPCSTDALALGGATPLAEWKPPTGCTENAGQGTSFHRTEAELKTQLECGASTPHGVDLAAHSVLRVTDSMSPATVGWLAYDDGKIITLVTKFRSPCPNDPRPMPISATRWYLVPTAERTVAEATCTIHPECPK